MGRRQPHTGDAAEARAFSFLTGSFLDQAKTQSASAVDFTCRGLLAGRDSSLPYLEPTLEFHVQVKSQRRFHVSRSTFREWLLLTETQPVFILVILDPTKLVNDCWYLSLHDWLLTSPGQLALTTMKPISFNIMEDCQQSDADGLNFHNSLQAEADRALANSSPWATLRDYGLFPFDEALFLEYLELAPYAEVPVEIFRRIAWQARPVALRALIATGESPDPIVKEWLRRINYLAAGQSNAGFQRRQFSRFVRTMERFRNGGILPRLPPFRIGEVNAWRAFVAMYPNSLKLLDHIVRRSKRASDIMFAAGMLPMLANASDRAISGAAQDTLRFLRERRQNFTGYAFEREIWRSQAESGDKNALEKVKYIVTRPENRTAELEFLEGYGWPESALEANLTRKLERPTMRDQNLTAMYEGLATALIGDTFRFRRN